MRHEYHGLIWDDDFYYIHTSIGPSNSSKDGQLWIFDFKTGGCTLYAGVEELIISKEFVPTDNVFDVCIIRPFDSSVNTIKGIIGKAKEKGFQLPTIELACLFRKSIKMGNVLSMMNLERLHFIYKDPLLPNSGRYDLVISNDRYGCSLSLVETPLDSIFSPNTTAFAFIKSVKKVDNK